MIVADLARDNGSASVQRPAIAAGAAANARPYLSAEQLCGLTPWTLDAIEKMIRRGILVRGRHYFQPTGQRGRLIFKWAAIVALIEERPIQPELESMIETPEADPSKTHATRQVLDVEKPTADLQRLLR
jgi:hypothetical protein